MKVLLDEQIDVRMKPLLSDFEVYTLHDFDSLGLRNGELALQLQANDFKFLITADKNMPFQQNPGLVKFTLVLLDIPSLIWKNQLQFSPKIVDLLQNPPLLPPKIVHIGIEGLSAGTKKAALLQLVGEEQVLFL